MCAEARFNSQASLHRSYFSLYLLDIHGSFFQSLDGTAESGLSLSDRLAQAHVSRSLRARRCAVLKGCSIIYRGIASEMAPLGKLFGAKTLSEPEIPCATRA